MTAIGSFALPAPADERKGLVVEDSDTLSVSVTPATVLSAAVPAGKKWRIRYAEVVCAGYGRWDLKVNTTRIGGGATGGPVVHDRTDMPGYIEADAGDTVEVLYTYSHGPAAMPIDVFVGVIEI